VAITAEFLAVVAAMMVGYQRPAYDDLHLFIVLSDEINHFVHREVHNIERSRDGNTKWIFSEVLCQFLFFILK